MKQSTVAVLTIIAAVLALTVLNSAYIVDETEQVVITRFGEPIRKSVTEPGLHWRLPFVELIHKFDKRILEWDGDPSQIPTRDKKYIWVDLTGRWRIKEPLVFFQTLHNENNAKTRLDDIFEGIARNFITRYNLASIVRNSNDILSVEVDADDIGGSDEYEEIRDGRNAITRQILESAREVLAEYGIEIIDIRIKRINYVQSVQQKVFERMISERLRAAEELRSEGLGVRAEIEGQKEKELKRIQSEAYRTAQTVRGEADAESTRIYGQAYSQDADFFSLIETLKQYPETLGGSRLVFSTDSEFLKYMKETE